MLGKKIYEEIGFKRKEQSIYHQEAELSSKWILVSEVQMSITTYAKEGIKSREEEETTTAAATAKGSKRDNVKMAHNWRDRRERGNAKQSKATTNTHTHTKVRMIPLTLLSPIHPSVPSLSFPLPPSPLPRVPFWAAKETYFGILTIIIMPRANLRRRCRHPLNLSFFFVLFFSLMFSEKYV